MLLDSNSNAIAMAYVDVKLFHSYTIAMPASIATALCVRGMALLSVISDLEQSCASWVLYIFFARWTYTEPRSYVLLSIYFCPLEAFGNVKCLSAKFR